MKENILALYDLSGIQRFIFHTNALKEIIGGSEIVRTLLEDALREFVRTRKGEKHHLDWTDGDKPQRLRFLEDEDVCSEVLYCGGGNLLVAWRDAALAHAAGRFMHRYILEHAYSLTLNYATVRMTSSYQADYGQLCANIARGKRVGYRVEPRTGCPFPVFERGTGLPAVARDSEDGRISRETMLKRRAERDAGRRMGDRARYCMQIDGMTAGSEKNYIAIIHIDGNSMGVRISNKLEECRDYATAVYEMRKLSRRISSAFTVTLNMAIQAQNMAAGGQPVCRPIICAGDDITVICRADAALELVRDFMRRIEVQAMCDRDDGGPDLVNYAFSACAGIVYAQAHYPFFMAYELCEQLCSEAKKKAKLPENLVNGQPGCYVDFHIALGYANGDIEAQREREYVNTQGYSLVQRPLLCKDGSERMDSVDMLLRRIAHFRQIPRSWLKRVRNAYCMNESDVHIVLEMATMQGNRRFGWDEDDTRAFDHAHRALYFDALELMDLIP